MTVSQNASESPPSRQAFRLSLDKVDKINRWRAQYVVIYFIWMALWAYWSWSARGAEMQWGSPEFWGAAALLILLGILFYFRFISVLRAMGYPVWTWLPTCFVAALPIPGVLVVAYMDRGIGKTLRKGLDARDAALREHEARTKDAGS